MGAMRTLRNKIDEDAVARVKAGIRHKPEPVKHKKVPRDGSTYRAARRNAVLHPAEGKPGVWRGPKTKYFPPPPVRPNKRDRARLGEPRR